MKLTIENIEDAVRCWKKSPIDSVEYCPKIPKSDIEKCISYLEEVKKNMTVVEVAHQSIEYCHLTLGSKSELLDVIDTIKELKPSSKTLFGGKISEGDIVSDFSSLLISEASLNTLTSGNLSIEKDVAKYFEIKNKSDLEVIYFASDVSLFNFIDTENKIFVIEGLKVNEVIASVKSTNDDQAGINIIYDDTLQEGNYTVVGLGFFPQHNYCKMIIG